MNLQDSGITDALKNSAITLVQYDCIKKKTEIQTLLHSDSFVSHNNVKFLNMAELITDAYLGPITWEAFVPSLRYFIGKFNQLLVNYQLIDKNGELSLHDKNGRDVKPCLMTTYDSLLVILGMYILRYISISTHTQYIKYFCIDNIAPYLTGEWLNKFIDFISSITNNHVKFIIFTQPQNAEFLYEKFRLNDVDVKSIFLLDIDRENKA